MTRDEVIALAKQAAFHTPVMESELLRFANLIHDHITWSDIHTCHPGCTKPPCVAMREAVLAEREACAKVCDEVELKNADGQLGTYIAGWSDGTDDCAAAIRSRT